MANGLGLSSRTHQKLGKRGITVYGLTTIPDYSSALPYACGERAYQVNDNGTGKVWSLAELLSAAEKK